MSLAQPNRNSGESGRESLETFAEFDHFADDYYEMHQKSIAKTGETPEYYTEYKIADLAAIVRDLHIPVARIADFGSGVGASVPFFRKHFPGSAINCIEVSPRSIEVAKARFPGSENYHQIEKGRIPIEDGSQDIVFSACVFHHIPHDQHVHWLGELRRIARPRGLLTIFEHNPLNPIMVRAVRASPMDANAHLIRASEMRDRARKAGWESDRITYRQFFPRPLAGLRPLEKYMGRLLLGAQYHMTARRPD